MDEWLIHGGAVDAAAERYGIARDRWLDLSTGINPYAYPLPDLATDYWHRLPDQGLYAWLHESAAACYGVEDTAAIVPVPGSQASIQWLPRLIPTARVAVLTPTYREHRASWVAAGHSVIEIRDLDELTPDADVVVVGNPNNPDGRTFEPARLLPLCERHLLIVDEAFADAQSEVSLARFAGRPGLIVLRSFGKFFGLAGMRLGFALLEPVRAEALRRALGPWAISGPAAAVGALALADDAWIRATRVRLTAAISRLNGLLMRADLSPIGGTALFQLLEVAAAAELFEHLAHEGILVRRFTDQPTWIRIGVPGSAADFDRLGSALAAWRTRAVRITLSSGASGDRPTRSGTG